MMKQTDRCHPDESRPFTTREYARIQSFPDEWQFAGKMNDIYKQIGNAVPVELADELVRQSASDTVVNELREKNPDLLKALYLLAFKEYAGFNNL